MRFLLITPGDLDFAGQGFDAQLSHHDRRRLASANRADRRCAGRNGLACPATATLEAMWQVRLMSRFSA